MLHHTFPDGRLVMDRLSLDLSNMSADDALLELDRADDKAFDIWRDFCSQITEARDRITNTGSIYGNVRAIALADATDNPTVCRTCLGKGGVNIANEDFGGNVWNTCPTCGGTRHAGPTIR